MDVEMAQSFTTDDVRRFAMQDDTLDRSIEKTILYLFETSEEFRDRFLALARGIERLTIPEHLHRLSEISASQEMDD